MPKPLPKGRGKAQADALRSTRSDTIAHKLLADGSIQEVSSTALRKGDRVKVVAGDMIPADGEVVTGVAAVDESAITGESAPVLKQPGTDIASSVTGGTRILSDELIINVTSDPGQGFIDRMIALVEGAERSKNTQRNRADGVAVCVNAGVSNCGLHDSTVGKLCGFSDHDRDFSVAAGGVDSYHDRGLVERDRHCRNGSRRAI